MTAVKKNSRKTVLLLFSIIYGKCITMSDNIIIVLWYTNKSGNRLWKYNILRKYKCIITLDLYYSFLAQFVNTNTLAVSSSTYGSYVASRTVDGNTDQKHTSCSHTNVSSSITDAWLRIDLGTVYSVKLVKFWYRGDNKYQYNDKFNNIWSSQWYMKIILNFSKW